MMEGRLTQREKHIVLIDEISKYENDCGGEQKNHKKFNIIIGDMLFSPSAVCYSPARV